MVDMVHHAIKRMIVNGTVRCKVRTRSLSTCIDKEHMLFSTTIQFYRKGSKSTGNALSVDAVYQDTMPSGSSIGTVIGMHGSPGSHKDWKYVAPRLHEAGVRLVAVNFPGFGLTADLPNLAHDNPERNSFVEALTDKLSLTENLVCIGHSRGAENALKFCAMNPRKMAGLVLLNSPGLRIHRGVRPFSVIQIVTGACDRFPSVRAPLGHVIHKVYNRLGLRTSSGSVAINAMRTMLTFALQEQAPFQKIVNENAHIRVLTGHSCNDFLIEEEIPREFNREFRDRVHLACKTSLPAEEAAMNAEMRKAFIEVGKRTVCCEFVPDGHFLQKTRGELVADAIVAMLEAARNEK